MTKIEIFQAITALSTLGLVIVTAIYTRATRKMAKFMEMQSKIMSKEFEKRVSPIIDIVMRQSVTSGERGIYHYVVCNFGTEPVKLKSVIAKLWHPDYKESILSPVVKKIDRMISQQHGIVELDLEISFAEINQKFPNPQDLSKILIQPTFIIENMNNIEFEFKRDPRSIR